MSSFIAFEDFYMVFLKFPFLLPLEVAQPFDRFSAVRGGFLQYSRLLFVLGLESAMSLSSLRPFLFI